jgi:O-methyltransferase
MSTSKHPLFGTLPDPVPGDDLVRKLLRKYPVPIDQSSPSKMYHVLIELERVLRADVPGHVVELGCFEGGTTMQMRRMLDKLKQKDRQLHVYDSWEGVPAPLPQDKPATDDVWPFEKGMCSAQRQTFEKNFERAELRLPHIHSGWFGDIPDVEYPSPIAFAFFDGDMYSSIIDSFTKVYSKLSKGARVVIDDYEWERLPGVKKACEDFLRDKPERETLLPNYYGPGLKGGALFVKL